MYALLFDALSGNARHPTQKPTRLMSQCSNYHRTPKCIKWVGRELVVASECVDSGQLPRSINQPFCVYFPHYPHTQTHNRVRCVYIESRRWLRRPSCPCSALLFSLPWVLIARTSFDGVFLSNSIFCWGIKRFRIGL